MVNGIGINKTNLIYSYINKSSQQNTNVDNKTISSLPSVVPQDFNVQIPQTYSKLGVEKLSNGQEIHCYKLANGQKVMIAPMNSPQTYVNTYVNTGAINEKDSERGISHFTEHMAFNGTLGTDGYMKLNKGDTFRKVAEMGGYTNACTSMAETNYTISIPQFEKNDLENAVAMQASMMNNLEMSNEMVDKEHGPVCSEINMYSDIIPFKAKNIATKSLYNFQSTSEDLVAGRVDNIQNVDKQKVTDYYKNNYYPANMTTVITGDVDPDTAIDLVAKYFKGTNKQNPDRITQKYSPIEKTIRQDLFSDKTKQTYATIAFNGPANNDYKGQVALDAALAVLFGKSNSRIKTPLNTSISPTTDKFSTNPTDGVAINFDIETNEENSEKYIKDVFEQLQKFKIKDENELQQIKDFLKSRLNDDYEAPDKLNYSIGKNSFFVPMSTMSDESKIVDSLTSKDIEDSVHKYLDTSKCSIAVVHPSTVTPEDLKNNYKKNNSSTSQVSFTGRQKIDDKPLDTDNISRYKLNNNYDIAFYNTPNNSNARMDFILTPQTPIKTKTGVIEILNGMLNQKTANKDINDFNQYLDNSNAAQDFEVMEDGKIFIEGKAPAKNIDNLIAITQEQLMAPALDEENFNTQKEDLKDLYSHKDPDSYTNFQSEVFKNADSYGKTSKEILSALDNVTLQDVKDCYNQILANAHATVAVVAPMEDRQVLNVTLNRFAKMPAANPNLPVKAQIYTPITKSKVVTEAVPQAQANIVQGYTFKDTGNQKDYISISLMNSILSNGDETGLFNNLREKEKLAYSVHSEYDKNADTGMVSCNILTTTDNKEIGEQSYDNVKKSIEGFNRQINKMKSGEFTEKELDLAKKKMKSELKSDAYSQTSKAITIEQGLLSPYGINKINDEYKLIDTMTKQDIINAANYVFANKPVYSIVASEDTINANKDYLSALEKN